MPQTTRELTIRSAVYERPDFLLDIAAFHEKFKLEYDGLPRGLSRKLVDFRSKFMLEELQEWTDWAAELDYEITKPQPDQERLKECLEETLDAGVDLLYVLMGTMYLQGLLPVFEEAWRRVHAANMSKVRALRTNMVTMNSGRDSEYDVVKPEGFIAPSHVDLIVDHAHTMTSLPGSSGPSQSSVSSD